jgi:hypothetical protein
LVKSRSYCDNGRFILLPEEVIGTGIDSLHFPRNLGRVKDFTGLPDPSTKAVFSTESFIDQSLVIEHVFEPILTHTLFHFRLDKRKGAINILQVSLLVKQMAEIFNIDSQEQLFGKGV